MTIDHEMMVNDWGSKALFEFSSPYKRLLGVSITASFLQAKLFFTEAALHAETREFRCAQILIKVKTSIPKNPPSPGFDFSKLHIIVHKQLSFCQKNPF